jgi:hypothetical protein
VVPGKGLPEVAERPCLVLPGLAALGRAVWRSPDWSIRLISEAVPGSGRSEQLVIGNRWRGVCERELRSQDGQLVLPLHDQLPDADTPIQMLWLPRRVSTKNVGRRRRTFLC